MKLMSDLRRTYHVDQVTSGFIEITGSDGARYRLSRTADLRWQDQTPGRGQQPGWVWHKSIEPTEVHDA